MRHVTHVITDLGDGGAQRSLFTLCENENRCSHSVISLRGMGKYGGQLEEIGIEVHCLNFPKGKITFKGVHQLVKLLSDHQIDVVQCWMYHANILASIAMLFKRPKNLCWGIRHTDLRTGGTPLLTKVVAKIGAHLSYFSPVHIVCCAETAREVHADFGYCKEKMVVVANGYDLEKFSPSASKGKSFKAKHDLDTEMPLIGFAARLNPQKDHTTLLQAIAYLKSNGTRVLCVLAGTGLEPVTSPLLQSIRKLDLVNDIKLIGPVSDVSAFMNAIDVHVMSSSFGEAFPNVLSEAMACGTPCVATNVGDAALIIGKAGSIVPPKQPVQLAEAIASLLVYKANTTKWEALQSKARRHIEENFSIQQFCDGHYMTWFPKE